MKHTCSLDIADRGDQTLDVVGQAFRVTRERIRQLEAKALRNGFVPAAKRAALDEDLDD
jgi:DNA-directed RNA polymerase sigma subunit (sigma70/sigma32)